MSIRESYILDNSGQKVAVVISYKEYKKMLEELEELEDIRLYDEVKEKKEPRIALEEYVKKRRNKKNAKV